MTFMTLNGPSDYTEIRQPLKNKFTVSLFW